jgi:hypothetical protein
MRRTRPSRLPRGSGLRARPGPPTPQSEPTCQCPPGPQKRGRAYTREARRRCEVRAEQNGPTRERERPDPPRAAERMQLADDAHGEVPLCARSADVHNVEGRRTWKSAKLEPVAATNSGASLSCVRHQAVCTQGSEGRTDPVLRDRDGHRHDRAMPWYRACEFQVDGCMLWGGSAGNRRRT